MVFEWLAQGHRPRKELALNYFPICQNRVAGVGASWPPAKWHRSPGGGEAPTPATLLGK